MSAKIHGPIDAGEWHFRPDKLKKRQITPSFEVAHGATRRVYLQQ
jgi:hypothetical protein